MTLPKVLVISLPKSSGRRAHARHQLGAVGVNYEFVDGVAGEAYAAHFQAVSDRTFLMNTGRVPTLGELGCYASHRKAWRRCFDSGQPVVVLEDDFLLNAHFPRALKIVARYVDRYGFLRLEAEQRAEKSMEEPVGAYQVWRYRKAPQGAMAYAISAETAKRFLEKSQVAKAPVDVFIKTFWQHGVPLFGLTPYCVTESAVSLPSTIGERRSAAKTLSQKLQRSLHRLKAVTERRAFEKCQASLSLTDRNWLQETSND